MKKYVYMLTFYPIRVDFLITFATFMIKVTKLGKKRELCALFILKNDFFQYFPLNHKRNEFRIYCE